MVHSAPADLIASPTLCLIEYYDKHMVRRSLSTRGLLIGQLLSLSVTSRQQSGRAKCRVRRQSNDDFLAPLGGTWPLAIAPNA